MASKRLLWNKLGRYFSAIVIAAFFLPFFGVSCDGMEVITVSGADMVGGCKPGGMITEMEDQGSRRNKRHGGDPGVDENDGGGGGSLTGHVEKVDREPLAIIALVLALALFAATWVRTRKGVTATLALSVATIGVLVGLWIKVGGSLHDAVDKEALGKSPGSRMTKDVKIDAGGRYGLWLSGLMLITLAGLSALSLREPETTPQTLPPGAPPPAV